MNKDVSPIKETAVPEKTLAQPYDKNLVAELSAGLEKLGYKIVKLEFTNKDLMEESFNGKPFVNLTLAKK